MNAPMEAQFDTENLYREETYTDRRVGTLRVMVPVTVDGTPDAARPTLFVGQVSVMTPMGALPITFEVPGATTLAQALAGFGEGAKLGGRLVLLLELDGLFGVEERTALAGAA